MEGLTAPPSIGGPTVGTAVRRRGRRGRGDRWGRRDGRDGRRGVGFLLVVAASIVAPVACGGAEQEDRANRARDTRPPGGEAPSTERPGPTSSVSTPLTATTWTEARYDVMEGTLVDGRPWAMRVTDTGPCVTVAGNDLGCEPDNGAVEPGAHPATPRLVSDTSVRASDDALVAYGYLPYGAQNVELISEDGLPVATPQGVAYSGWAIWTCELEPGTGPIIAAIYEDSVGNEVARVLL